MLFLYLNRSQKNKINTKVIFITLLTIVGITTSGFVKATQANCRLLTPKYESANGKAVLSILVDCKSGGKKYPSDKDLIAGLTVYSKPFIQDRESDSNSLTKIVNGRERRVLIDSHADAFDFPVQTFRVSPGKKKRIEFEVSDVTIEGKIYLLFAIWPETAKKNCNQGLGARPGCSAYGYILGNSDGVDVIDAYPGLAEANPGLAEGIYDRLAFESLFMSDYGPTERWIVEAFR